MQNQRLAKLLEYLNEDPHDAFTKYAIALEYISVDKEKALEYFTKLTIENPDYIGTYYQLGTLLSALNRKEEAEKFYKKGIDVASQQKDMHALAELRSALNKLLGLDYEDD